MAPGGATTQNVHMNMTLFSNPWLHGSKFHIWNVWSGYVVLMTHSNVICTDRNWFCDYLYISHKHTYINYQGIINTGLAMNSKWCFQFTKLKVYGSVNIVYKKDRKTDTSSHYLFVQPNPTTVSALKSHNDMDITALQRNLYSSLLLISSSLLHVGSERTDRPPEDKISRNDPLQCELTMFYDHDMRSMQPCFLLCPPGRIHSAECNKKCAGKTSPWFDLFYFYNSFSLVISFIDKKKYFLLILSVF